LQISIHKIVKNIVITEDGKVFNIDSMPIHQEVDASSSVVSSSIPDQSKVSLQQIQIVCQDKGEQVTDRIKDLGVASNGFVYVTEKGEVFLASTKHTEDPLNLVFKTAPGLIKP
jgi:hydrogenase maturation factor HypE